MWLRKERNTAGATLLSVAIVNSLVTIKGVTERMVSYRFWRAKTSQATKKKEGKERLGGLGKKDLHWRNLRQQKTLLPQNQQVKLQLRHPRNRERKNEVRHTFNTHSSWISLLLNLSSVLVCVVQGCCNWVLSIAPSVSTHDCKLKDCSYCALPPSFSRDIASSTTIYLLILFMSTLVGRMFEQCVLLLEQWCVLKSKWDVWTLSSFF